MIRRSAAVAVAATLHQLIAGKTAGWTPDQEMVLDALRRSKVSLHDATDGELATVLPRAASTETLYVLPVVKSCTFFMCANSGLPRNKVLSV